MKGCLDCKHKDNKMIFDDQNKPVFIKGCKKGEDYEGWWERNAKKNREEINEQMACFEPTETSVFLDDMMTKLKELGKVIDKSQENG